MSVNGSSENMLSYVLFPISWTYFMFHEMPLNCISWNTLKEKFHLALRTYPAGCLWLIQNIAKSLRVSIKKEICKRLLLKMCSWNWEKFNFTLKIQYQCSTSISETNENVCFYFMIGFPRSLYLHTIFLWWGEKLTSNTKYLKPWAWCKSGTRTPGPGTRTPLKV